MLQHNRRPLIPTLLFVTLLFSVAEMRGGPQFVDLFEFNEPIVDVAFRSGSEGYALEGHRFWRTVDGGKTWEMEFPQLFHVPFTSMALIGEGGIVIGDGLGDMHIFVPEDSTWLRSSPGRGKAIIEIEAYDDKHWVAITDSLVLSTNDGGETYTTFAASPNRQFIAVSLTSPTLMHVAESAVQIWRSVDGGETWEKASQDFGEIYDVLFLSSDTGFVSSWYPWNLFTTTDGAETWTRGPFEYPTTIDVVSGGTGVYAASDYIRLSGDGGMTWGDPLHLKDLASGGISELYTITEVITPENGFVYVHASNPETRRSIVTRVDVTSDVKEQVRRDPDVLEIAHHTNR